MASISVFTTRDLMRRRPFENSPISHIASSFIAQLTSATESGTLLRSAFLPALLKSDKKPGFSDQNGHQIDMTWQEADKRILELLKRPPAIIVPQGVINTSLVTKAWNANPEGMKESIFVPFALHKEMEAAREEGDAAGLANLGVFLMASIAYELAQWIFVRTHGYTAGLVDLVSNIPSGSIVTTSSSSQPQIDRGDVGDKAVGALFGFDFEWLAYAVGTREVIKRRYPARRAPSMTPPIIYAILGDTPVMFDASNYPAAELREIPGWKDARDPMANIISISTHRGVADFHGHCLL